MNCKGLKGNEKGQRQKAPQLLQATKADRENTARTLLSKSLALVDTATHLTILSSGSQAILFICICLPVLPLLH